MSTTKMDIACSVQADGCDLNGKLLIPGDLDNETKARYTAIMESIRESSKYARGALLNERGQILWEEPIDEYEKRMLELKVETGSCIPNIKVIARGITG